MNKTLSIIIPVYNAELYLLECVNSIVSQMTEQMEIVLIDDGSTDNSLELCKKLEQADRRIKCYHQDNAGVASARNLGIQQSEGECLMFVDSDDILPNGTLVAMLNEVDKYDFIMGGYAVFVDVSNITKIEHCKPYAGNIKTFLENVLNYIHPPCLLGPCFKIFKKQIILSHQDIEFPKELSYGEDAVFVLRYLRYASEIKCIDKTCYLYRKSRSDSLSSKFRTDKIDINMIIADLLKRLLQQNKCENTGDIYADISVGFFDNYTTELMNSKVSNADKREIYIEKARVHNIYEYYQQTKNISLVQKIRMLAIKSKFGYLLMNILYKIKRFV